MPPSRCRHGHSTPNADLCAEPNQNNEWFDAFQLSYYRFMLSQNFTFNLRPEIELIGAG